MCVRERLFWLVYVHVCVYIYNYNSTEKADRSEIFLRVIY